MNWTAKLQRTTDTDGVVELLEMSAPSFGATLRVANDTRDWVSRGQTYLGFEFQYRRPDDVAGVMGQAEILICNIGREVTADLEGWQPNDEIVATLHLADRGDPDSIFDSLPIPVTRVSATQIAITAVCGVDHIMRQAGVKRRYTPFTTPGIF